MALFADAMHKSSANGLLGHAFHAIIRCALHSSSRRYSSSYDFIYLYTAFLCRIKSMQVVGNLMRAQKIGATNEELLLARQKLFEKFGRFSLAYCRC